MSSRKLVIWPQLVLARDQPDHTMRPRVLAITGGHSYDKAAFEDLLDSLPADVTWVEHPDAMAYFSPQAIAKFDVNLHYDMPGGRLTPEDPPAGFASSLDTLVKNGHGFVVMHHALASWPGWSTWSELVGGQYLYAPGVVRGESWPDSGFRHNVRQHLSPVGTHPILAGLETGFDITDETYLCPMFTDEVTPLMETDAPITDDVHVSTMAAVRSGNVNQTHDPTWKHPKGPALAAWCREHGRSRWVYVQPGDTAQTLRDPNYQRLITNSLLWASAHKS
jgi:type 1 glutamine amidotransferase